MKGEKRDALTRVLPRGRSPRYGLRKGLLGAFLTVGLIGFAGAETPYFSSHLCLALNLYYESRCIDPRESLAINAVVWNRAKGLRENICSEIYKPYQFSWTQLPGRKIDEKKAWGRCLRHASEFLSLEEKPHPGLLFFHARTIRPKWAKSLCPVVSLGGHIFYSRRCSPSPQSPSSLR